MDASEIWQYHLGKDRFPCGVSNKSNNDSFDDSLILFASNNKGKTISYNDTEEFIEDYFPVDIKYDLKIDCQVSQNRWRDFLLSDMPRNTKPLLPEGHLKFIIKKNTVPKPFDIKWKVCNVGQEAIKRNCIRGQIVNDNGSHTKIESSDFRGSHFVECYIIKNNICVAMNRIDVRIKA